MQVFPRFARNDVGRLTLHYTPEATVLASRPPAWSPAAAEDHVMQEAKEAVTARGGDASYEKDVLGEYIMQSGKFRGQTFRWMLENAPGYAGWLVCQIDHEAQTNVQSKSSLNQQKNKFSFKRYMEMFSEGRELIILKKGSTRPATTPSTEPPAAAPSCTYTSLLRGSTPSPQILKKRVMKITSPAKVTPNIPPRRPSITPSEDDLDLIGCLDKYESSQPGSRNAPTAGREKSPAANKSQGGKETVLQAGELKSPESIQPSSSKSPRSAQYDVRSVSGAPTKIVRHLFLAQQTTFSGEQAVKSTTPPTTSTRTSGQLMLHGPFQRPQPPAACEVPLLKRWRATLPTVDHNWVSTALFTQDHLGCARLDFTKLTALWVNPPQPSLVQQSVPKIHHFFGHRMFFWMPVKLWSLKIACPHPDCDCLELSYAGVYQIVRQVLDVSSHYNLVSETLMCKKCRRKMVSWSHNILTQIDIAHRSQFPCLLTTMKACDMKVVILMRQRGLGNSASQVQKKLQEEHSTEWYNRTIQYLSACKTIKSAALSGLVEAQIFHEPPPPIPVPLYRWLMQVYIQDVLFRLDEVKANITSVFGRILKVDSTKKVTKKLAGPSAGTAEWATNVGNEYGQVLISVLTAGEGRFGLHRMAKGLMKRYMDANQPPPEAMYVDRDCCGVASTKLLFADWQQMHVRLDVWHFMRRFSSGCHTDSHPLYGLFMQKLSQCIFAWDDSDLQELKAAKKSELISRHIRNPSDDIIMRSITKNDLAIHCRRTTRGVDETRRLIGDLIYAFDGEKGRDTLGVPLINSRRMREEWEAQQRHVACLQDPEHIRMYIQTGTMKKGGHLLPTYRSCRGSTSLESFHLHLNRFIPGTLANDTVFQAYLVDGLSRWNKDRASALTSTKEPQSYSGLLQFTANQLTEEIFQKRISLYTPPRKYTGELIGIEYLYDQTGRPLQEYDDDILRMEETGLDVPEEDDGLQETEVDHDMTISDFQRHDSLNVRVQSEPRLELSPGPSQEQWKRAAPVLKQPPSATSVRVQSEPRLELSPGPSQQWKRAAPVVEQPFQPHRESSPASILEYPTDRDYRDMHDEQPSDDSVGPDNIPGFGRVQELAAYLTTHQSGNLCLSSAQAEEVVRLWTALDDYDKNPIVFNPMFAKHARGRFRAKRQALPGVESTERSIRGPDSVPAARPDCNRYVEGVIHRLCVAFPGPRRREGHTWSRWSLILEAYTKIKATVCSSATVTIRTNIQLPDINQKTLKSWHNDKARDVSRQVLYQGIRLPEASFVAPQQKPLPEPQRYPRVVPRGDGEQLQFNLPTDTSGTAVHISKKRRLVQPEMSRPTPADASFAVQAPTLQAAPPVSAPYTTVRYRKKKAAEESTGLRRRKYDKLKERKCCKKCGEVIEKPGHQYYFGNVFCARSESLIFEIWKLQFAHKGYGKKK